MDINLNYFTLAVVAAVFWGMLTLIEANLANKKMYGPLFLKLLIFGLTGLCIFVIYKNEIIKDIGGLWKNNKKDLLLFIISLMLFTGLTQFFLYKSLNSSINKTSIIIAIIWGLPLVISTIGSYLFLKEKINMKSLFAIGLILLGIFILKIDN
tara:strand:- start:166 stop:624 length:459 start_codon:yes stop_codon:yes gene_type:complete